MSNLDGLNTPSVPHRHAAVVSSTAPAALDGLSSAALLPRPRFESSPNLGSITQPASPSRKRTASRLDEEPGDAASNATGVAKPEPSGRHSRDFSVDSDICLCPPEPKIPRPPNCKWLLFSATCCQGTLLQGLGDATEGSDASRLLCPSRSMLFHADAFVGFMLFRKYHKDKIQAGAPEISSVLGEAWQSLSEEEQRPWKEAAEVSRVPRRAEQRCVAPSLTQFEGRLKRNATRSCIPTTGISRTAEAAATVFWWIRRRPYRPSGVPSAANPP